MLSDFVNLMCGVGGIIFYLLTFLFFLVKEDRLAIFCGWFCLYLLISFYH